MTQHFAVPIGKIKLVIYDDRKDSATYRNIQEIQIGVDNYKLVRSPPLVWYSFGAIGDDVALIANCTDLQHDPEESFTISLDDKQIPYTW